MKLHLCCGDIYLYTHENYDVVGTIVTSPPIDARTLNNYYDNREIGDRRKVYVDGYLDLLDIPWKWADNSVEEVVLISAIEHFALRDAQKIVDEIYRILKLQGRLIVDFPDIIESVKLDPDMMMRHIYGSYRDEWAVHKWGYTKESFRKLLGAGWIIEWRTIINHPYPTIGCDAIKF